MLRATRTRLFDEAVRVLLNKVLAQRMKVGAVVRQLWLEVVTRVSNEPKR